MRKWLLTAGLLVLSGGVQAAEDSLYDFHWLDPDKSVYVLQNKIHKKEKRLTFDLGYLSNLTSEFQDTSGLLLGAGWYWHEEWGLEVFYLSYMNKDNDALKNVKESADREPYVRRQKTTMAAGLIWSPFYGKVNTFNRIYYFDWSFGAGLASVTTENNLRTVQIIGAATEYDTETETGAYIKTNIKFHINERWNVGVGYLGTFYQAAGPQNPNSKKWKLNNDVLFTVGISF